MNDRVTPLVSVVIPSYNHARYLRSALQSILDQTYTNWEAIVIENHSTDNTDEVMASFTDPRITYLKIHNNGIIAASRNVGIRAAKGEWIAFLDSDDWWSGNKLQVCFDSINDKVDLVYHDLEIVTDKRQPFSRKISKSWQVRTPVLIDLLLKGNAIVNSSVVVRRSLLEQIGGINESVEMIASEDYNTWLRIAQLTEQFVYLPCSLGYYLTHTQSLSQKDMSVAGRCAVAEFVPALKVPQKLKLEANFRYTSLRFNYLTVKFSEIKLDLLFVLRHGNVVIFFKSTDTINDDYYKTELSVLTKLNIIKVDYLKAAVLFLPIILYGPFVFSTMVYPPIRIGAYLLLSFYLFFKSTCYFKKDVLIFCILFLLSIFLVSGNRSGTIGLFSTGNFLLTMFFGWGLFRYFSTSTRRAEILIELYVKFFFLVSIFSLLSVLFLLTFGELDLFGFNLNPLVNPYPYKVTPFGYLLEKRFGSITVYRSFFYFIEPVYLSIFYAANIFLIAPYIKVNSRLFFMANVVGGLLTYSYAFYIMLIALYIAKNLKSHFILISMLILLFILMYYLQIIDVFLYSSYNQRLERLLLFTTSIETASTLELLFGHGVRTDPGFSMGFSSGLAVSIYELGIIPTVLEMLILFRLRPSFIIFVFFIIASAVIDPIKLPIFWFLIIITSHTLSPLHIHNPPGWGKRLSGR